MHKATFQALLPFIDRKLPWKISTINLYVYLHHSNFSVSVFRKLYFSLGIEVFYFVISYLIVNRLHIEHGSIEASMFAIEPRLLHMLSRHMCFVYWNRFQRYIIFVLFLIVVIVQFTLRILPSYRTKPVF